MRKVCKNCREPIEPCKPWGWRHLDGPVMCGIGEMEAEPIDWTSVLLTALDYIARGNNDRCCEEGWCTCASCSAIKTLEEYRKENP